MLEGKALQTRLEAWIEHELGLQLLEPFNCLQSSKISSWFEASTVDGKLFLKVSPQTAEFEGRVGQMLSRRAPGFIPDVLGVNTELGAIVTRKLEAHNLSFEVDTNIWLVTMRRLAALQRSSLDWECELPRLDLVSLLESCRNLMNDAFELGHLGLTASQVSGIQALAPKLSSSLEIFQNSGLPNTLIHGDFHANNLLVENGVPILIDWSEAAIASPLLDLGRFLEFLQRSHLEHHGAQKIELDLISAFYEPWRDQVPKDSFFAAARVAPFVATLVFAARAWERESFKAPFLVGYHLKRAVKIAKHLFTPIPTPAPD
jgi:hypothetical protein